MLSPVPIAAAAILDAAWGRVALFGVPLAVLWRLSARPGRGGSQFRRRIGIARAGIASRCGEAGGGSAVVLLLATAIPLMLLIVQSIGDIPSEPLGGGAAREMILGVGRPLILLRGRGGPHGDRPRAAKPQASF